MKLILKPEVDIVTQRDEHSQSTGTGVSKDGHVRWMYDEGYLEVISSRTNGTLASWRFGKVVKDNQTFITSVTDIKTQAGLILLVATSNMSDYATICMFSLKARKVIGAIEVPRKVTALEVVFVNETDNVSPWIISKHLQFFSGLVAVGTEGGYIYLVDLCLDELSSNVSNEVSPKKLKIITPRIVDPVEKREQACAYDKHLALLLDEQCHRQEHFYYRRQDDSVQKVFEEETVWVSCLTYMEQAGTLAVGFNFGGFQLWRLYNPVLDYSSRYSSDGQAVVNFAVQEPENDPRNFVYLWVAYDDATVDSVSSVCLYQLSYSKKDTYANYGHFFDDLESVCPRIDQKLTVDPYSVDPRGTSRSILISCYTLRNHLYTPPAVLSDSFEEGIWGNDLSLSVFVWRADNKQGGRGTATSHYWMSVFDINRWYHAQVPQGLRCHGASVQVCSFWAVYDLGDVIAQLPSHALLNVEISGEKVLRFINNAPVPPEEHSYPSALQLFEVMCVMPDGCVQVHCHGWQRQLLEELLARGAQHLVRPADFYHQCLRARLLPQNVEDIKNRSTEYQRQVLLDMALERGLAPGLIQRCIRLWQDGEFVQEGCSLQMLLDWAWESLVATKNLLDTTCSMLFDWSGLHLDERTDWQIARLTQNLVYIKQIFTIFTVQAVPTTERGQFELELREGVVNILHQHFEVVRWALTSSLLPEIDEASEPSPKLFAFPAKELQQVYKKRRAELAHMKGSVDNMSLLMVDCMLECQGPHIKKVWESLGGDGMYPPPSMQAMLNMYLLDDVSLELKHALMFYFLRDLAALEPTVERETAVASFTQRFLLTPSLVHQVQGLWFIDHHDFEEGVRQLVKTNVPVELCEGWRGSSIVSTLLAQGQGRLANLYMHSKQCLGGSPEEQLLYVSVLVDNRQVSQGLEYLRGWDDEQTSSRLMSHLLKECQSHKLLGQLLQLNLTQAEEVSLEMHLRARPEPHALEPLFLYFLHRSSFLQAFRLNQELNIQDKLETSLASQEQSLSRNRLMEAYLRVMPDVTRKMLLEKQTMHAVATSAKRIQIDKPKPLSTVVHKADIKFMSQAQFIVAVIDKVNEAKVMLQDDDEEEEAEEEVSVARPVAKDGYQMDLSKDVAFLNTPRTPKSTARRKSEVISFGGGQSPVVTKSLLFSAKKTLSMLQAADNQEDRDNLKKLASECLQVLQTPVRDHKRKSTSPRKVDTAVKTPQSILKVRRLSRTLTGSREHLKSRRNSGSRPFRLSISKSETSSSLPSSPVDVPLALDVTPATSKQTLSSETPGSVTSKQLRFLGVSPSPTPSPSAVVGNISVEAEKSESVPNVTLSPEPVKESQMSIPVSIESVEESVSPAVATTCITEEVENEPKEVVKEDAEESMEEDLGDSSAPLPADLQKERLEKDDVDTRLSNIDISFEEGPDDRYSEKLQVLVRPDLQSPWKQPSPKSKTEDLQVDDEISFQVKASQVAGCDPSESNVEVATSDKLVSITSVQSKDGQEIAAYVSEETISVTTRMKELVSSISSAQEDEDFQKPSVSPELLRRSRRQSRTPDRFAVESNEPSSLPSRHESRTPERPAKRKISASPTMSSPPRDLQPLQVETVLPISSNKRDESPPATPPSSKRAKLMASEGDIADGDGEQRQKYTPSPKEEPTARQLGKTLERKSLSSVSLDTEDPLRDAPEEISAGRQTRKSPSRGQTLESTTENIEEAEMISPDDQMITEDSKRKTRHTPDRKSPSREPKSTPLRKSPSRQVKISPQRQSPAREVRHTPERKSPSRELKSTPLRKSPSRQMSGIPERIAGEHLSSEDETITPVRRSPSRQVRKTPDRKSPARDLIAKSQGKLSPVRELEESARKTPERKSPARQLRKTPERKPPVREAVSVTSKSPSRRVKTEELLDRKTPEKISQAGPNDDSFPSVQDQVQPTRRSSRASKTPDRLVKEGSSEKILSVTITRRKSKTPERHTTGESSDETRLTRSRRQSKTPERSMLDDVFEQSASSRRFSRLIKTPERLQADHVISPIPGQRRKRQDSKTLDTDDHLVEDTTQSSLKRPRQSSKTPDKHISLTPTRQSKRLHKSPEVLNTKEIEPVSLQISPRNTAGAAVKEPATPPRMSRGEELKKEPSSKVAPLDFTSVTAEIQSEEDPLPLPTRRSKRREPSKVPDTDGMSTSESATISAEETSKDQEKRNPPRAKRKRAKLNESAEEISLLVGGTPSPGSISQFSRATRTTPNAQQRAAAAVLERIKKPRGKGIRLIPTRKRSSAKEDAQQKS